MIVCNILALVTLFAQLQRMCVMTSTSMALTVIVIITSPVAGIVVDTCIGKFKAIQVSIVLLMLSSFFNILLMFLQDYLPTTAETVILLCTAGICCIGGSCYVACIFPFVADQLIGASGEQLSFAVYWLLWGFTNAMNTMVWKGVSSHYIETAVNMISFVCISAMVIILAVVRSF